MPSANVLNKSFAYNGYNGCRENINILIEGQKNNNLNMFRPTIILFSLFSKCDALNFMVEMSCAGAAEAKNI